MTQESVADAQYAHSNTRHGAQAIDILPRLPACDATGLATGSTIRCTGASLRSQLARERADRPFSHPLRCSVVLVVRQSGLAEVLVAHVCRRKGSEVRVGSSCMYALVTKS